jgi:arsenite/tail-anchored protein-transporting ATPase
MRVIIFTGKGGAGTSTIAAATACALAEGGQRTLAFGIARGIGDALGTNLGLEPTTVSERLDAAEGHGGPDEFRDWLESLLEWRNMDPELAEDLASLPGVNHIGRLLELESLATSEAYEIIVMDAPELSQFLDLPAALDAAARWLDRLFAPRQQNVFEPFVRVFAADYASVGEEIFETGRELLTRLADIRDLFADHETTSVRVVLRPEPSAGDTLREALSVLGLFGYRTDAALLGRLLPDEADGGFFKERRQEQQRAFADMESVAGPQKLALYERSARPVSPEALLAFAAAVYGSAVPGAFLADAAEHTVEKDDAGYVLRVAIPYAKREGLRLEEVDEGIAVHLNGRRCVVTLPNDVRYRSASSWSYEGDTLSVVLER